MITDINYFDASKICFLKPEETKLKNIDMIIKRIPIRIRDTDGNLKPLLIATDKCSFFGIIKNRNYKLQICLFDNSQSDELVQTEHQKAFVKAFEKIVEVCKNHCLKKLEVSEKHEIDKMGRCLYFGRNPEKHYPELFAKIPFNMETKKFSTTFYEMNNVEDTTEGGKETDPLLILGKKVNVKVLIYFDYISVSEDSIRLQIKTEEVNFQKNKRRRIMSSAVAAPRKQK